LVLFNTYFSFKVAEITIKFSDNLARIIPYSLFLKRLRGNDPTVHSVLATPQKILCLYRTNITAQNAILTSNKMHGWNKIKWGTKFFARKRPEIF